MNANSFILESLNKIRAKLLDLTARNRLLNFPISSKTNSIRMIDELPDQVHDVLLGNGTMEFRSIPYPTRKMLIEHGYLEIDENTGEEIVLKAKPDAKEWANVLGLSTSFDLPLPTSQVKFEEKHTDKAIQILMFPHEMETRLRNLRNKAQTAKEEMGANILYLSLGYLEWFESQDSDKARLAPLFLIPSNLNRGILHKKSGVYRYTLEYSGEDILINLSLDNKLRNDFGIVLPKIDELSEPEAYFKELEANIETEQPRWKVRRFGTLSLLNFNKMIMYLDLDPDRWPDGDGNIVNHPVISRFFKSQDDDQNSSKELIDEYEIDALDKIHEMYPLIEDADSSQHSALIDAINGKDLVIEGPPGTGKSQTITNLIAAALGQGKKVLFVAEKMAALEVVKSKLDIAGLGDFCLELHSHKSHKRKILENISTRLTNQRNHIQAVQIDPQIERYEDLKDELNTYAVEINSKWENTGLSIHEIFSGATRFRKLVDKGIGLIELVNINGKTLTKAHQLKLSDQISSFVKISRDIKNQLTVSGNSIDEHPWSGVQNTKLQYFEQDNLVGDLQKWQDAIGRLVSFNTEIVGILECAEDDLSNMENTKFLSEELESLPTLRSQEYFLALPILNDSKNSLLSRHLNNFYMITELYKELSNHVESTMLQNVANFQALSNPRSWFNKLDVSSTVSISEIDKCLSVLGRIINTNMGVEHLESVLEHNIFDNLSNSHEDIMFLLDIIECSCSLDSRLFEKRDEIFDQEETDKTIEETKTFLNSLSPLHRNISSIYDLTKEYDYDTLYEIELQLGRKDLFKYIDRDWRDSRRKLLYFSKSTAISLRELKSNLPDLISYTSLSNTFEASATKKSLGNFYKHVYTDIESLVSLRTWYKTVRDKFGYGYDKKARAADIILTCSVSDLRDIANLNKSAFPNELKQLIDDIDTIDAIIGNFKSEYLQENPILGDHTIIKNFRKALLEWRKGVSQWLIPNIPTLSAVNEVFLDIEKLDNHLSEWIGNDILKNVFSNSVVLEIGIGKDNKDELEIIENTLSYSMWLYNKNRSPLIVKFILQSPCKQTHEKLAEMSIELDRHIGNYDESYTRYSNLSELNYEAWLSCFGGINASLEYCYKKNAIALGKPEWLNGWINYVRTRNQMIGIGLKDILEKVQSKQLSLDLCSEGLSLAIYDQLAKEIILEKPHLLQSSSHSHNAIQADFKKYDIQLKGLQRKVIAAKIANHNAKQGVSGGRKSDYTELSLIRNELGKKARHIPIRQLMKRAGKAILEIKPCFMMGPVSAAHYLHPGLLNFDLVIMDEASQIKPEDAFGVIARGKQLVVVGDPKQLPPTSFFDRSDFDDDYSEDNAAVLETDSILDAAMPLFPMRRLRWHYRSQHESLIEYSNRNFYDNDLVVFPSPNSDSTDYGVKYTYIRLGRFVNQYNMEEARVIAKYTAKHAINSPNESLGIVAMSSKQREQIERAVEELCKADDIAANAIDKLRSREHPLFIKNLENVQGDERDVIYISMTYGPAELGGKTYQRFGPINTDVGWRRLNVLYTRARKRMHVFSSMKHSDVIADERSKKGVHALKGFLYYAETGKIEGIPISTGKPPDSDFEISVITALHNEGFECEPQVGVAGFYIDIAVKDPGNPGRYLVGIECDGATYHSAKSARDRDRLRQEVLERLGWKIMRIWSTDWFSNPDGELRPIIDKLNSLKSEGIRNTEINDPESEEIFADVIEIISDVNSEKLSIEEESISEYITSDTDLKESLELFGNNVIIKKFPNTPKDRRILRSAMIEALVEEQPVSKSEFTEFIPQYLRMSTSVEEAKKYLDKILDIVSGVGDSGESY